MLTGIVGYIITTVLSYVCRMIFVRCLSVDYLGLNGLFSNVISMLSLAELGVGSAIIYSLYKPIAVDDKEKIASLMHLYKIIYRVIGFVILGLGVVSIPLVMMTIGDVSAIKENVYVIYGLFLFNTVNGYFLSYRGSLITAYQRDYVVTGLGYVSVFVMDVIQIVILLTTGSYLAYIIIQVTCTFFCNIAIAVYAKKCYPFVDKKDAKPLEKSERKSIFKDIRHLMSYKLSGVLVNNTDNIVITIFGGLVQTGVTSNYTLLTNTLSACVNTLFGSLTASVGNLNATEDKDKRYSMFKVINLANFWLYGWLSLLIVFVSSNVVEICFGADYVMDISIPLILAINVYMVGMQNAVWTYKNTLGLFKYGRYILLITAAINIVGDIVFGKLLGVFGIFLATAVARLLTNTWYEPYALFKHGLEVKPVVYLKKYLTLLLILVGVGGVCYGVCYFIHLNIWVETILKTLICSVAFNGAIVLYYHKTEEFKYLWGVIPRIINRIFHKKSNESEKKG